MTRILGFIFLFLVGSGSLVYGLLYHTVSVEEMEMKKRDVSVEVPVLPGMDESLPESGGHAEPAAEEKSPPKGKTDPDEGNPFDSSPSNGKPAANSENPFESHVEAPAPLRMKVEKHTVEYPDITLVPESAIVQDMTIGGVVLQPDGQLKRTYSGKPPSQCPT
jgi:hypothetical protein